MNRLWKMSEASSGTTVYGYDVNSNWITKTLPNGDLETGSYDALNRMVFKCED